MKKILLFAIIFSLHCIVFSFFAPPTNAAPPSIDAKSQSTGTGTWKQTVGNNPNRILLVGVGGTPTSVTFNNLPLTKVNATGGGPNSTLWYLINPPAGTYDVKITGATNGGSVSLYNVDTLYPFGPIKGATGTYSFIGVLGIGIGSTTFYPNMSLYGTNTNQVIIENSGWTSANYVAGLSYKATTYQGEVSLWLKQETSGADFGGMGQYTSVMTGGSFTPGYNEWTNVGWTVNMTTLGVVSGTWAQTAVAVNGTTYTPTVIPTPSSSPVAGVCPGATPNDIVLVVDHSHSMLDWDYYMSYRTKMQVAIDGLRKFVDIIAKNSPNTRISVVQFAGSQQYPNKKTASGILYPLSTNYAAIKNTIGSMQVATGGLSETGNDGTCIACGYDLANKVLETASTSGARKIVILITDGIANQTTISNGYHQWDENAAGPEALVKVSEGLSQYNSFYRTVGVGTLNVIDEPFLKQIGAGKGGLYYNSPANGSLDQILQSISNLDFPCYGVSGNVFLDNNKNGVKDSSEANFADIPILGSNLDLVTGLLGGGFLINTLSAGPVNISLPSLPIGYKLTYPLNGPPPSYDVVVGPSCSTNGAPGAICSGGNITNLNFGITNSLPWVQTTCGSIRSDTGITNNIPSTAINPYMSITGPGCSEPGTIYVGDGFNNFGQAKPSTRQWLIGGTTYPEVYNSSLQTGISTSYDAMLQKAKNAKLPITDLSTICTLSNCTLPATLPHGIYQAKGNLALNAYTIPLNNDYIFLVDGDLNVRGTISVPNGSGAIFSSAKNISIASNVGVAPTSTATSIEGIYSADQSFIVNSVGTCADLRLNIGGNVIINTSHSDGTFENRRDICTNNALYPTISLVQRLDFLFNLPEFIRTQNTITTEAAQ